MTNNMTELDKILKKVASYIEDGCYTSAQEYFSDEIESVLEKHIHKQFKSREKLENTGDVFVHYTSMKVIIKMLTQVKKESKEKDDNADGNKDIPDATFRMYHTESLNDPEEGKFAEKFYEQFTNQHKWINELNQNQLERGAFVSSFSKCPNNEEDNLMFWMLYGRKGRGCSIKIKLPSKRDNFIFEHIIYYKSSNTDIWNFEGLMQSMEQFHEQFGNNYSNVVDAICERFLISINRYFYLLKNSHYEHEKEYRFLATANETSDNLFDVENIHEIRRYINGPKITDCLITDSVITVGPCVRFPHTAKICIKKLLKDANLPGPQVNISKVKYRVP